MAFGTLIFEEPMAITDKFTATADSIYMNWTEYIVIKLQLSSWDTVMVWL